MSLDTRVEIWDFMEENQRKVREDLLLNERTQTMEQQTAEKPPTAANPGPPTTDPKSRSRSRMPLTGKVAYQGCSFNLGDKDVVRFALVALGASQDREGLGQWLDIKVKQSIEELQTKGLELAGEAESRELDEQIQRNEEHHAELLEKKALQAEKK